MGNHTYIYIVNSTSEYEGIPVQTNIAHRAPVLVSAALAPTLQQVKVKQQVLRIYGGEKEPKPQPTQPSAGMEGDGSFLESLDLENSHWYKVSNANIQGRFWQLLLFYCDEFTTKHKKVGLATI